MLRASGADSDHSEFLGNSQTYQLINYVVSVTKCSGIIEEKKKLQRSLEMQGKA